MLGRKVLLIQIAKTLATNAKVANYEAIRGFLWGKSVFESGCSDSPMGE